MDFQTPAWVCDYMVSLVPDGVVTVLEPTPGEGNLVRALGGYRVTAPVDFWLIEGWWDYVVMNPPFSPMSEGYEVLYRCMEYSDNVVALMPWLVLINSERRTRRVVDFGLVSVTHLPRSAFPGSRVQTCVLEMRRGYGGDTRLLFLERPGY